MLSRVYLIKVILFIVISILINKNIIAQKKFLTKEQMLKGAPHQITKPLPYFIMWEDDQNFIIAKKENVSPGYNEYRINAKTLKETKLDKGWEKKSIEREVKLAEEDIFLTDVDGQEYQLTQTESAEKNPTLSPDQNKVAFTRDHNL